MFSLQTEKGHTMRAEVIFHFMYRRPKSAGRYGGPQGPPSYKLYISRTNFIFFGQLLYLSDKLYIFPDKINIPCTNFIFCGQLLYLSDKLYIFPDKINIPCTNFIFLSQTLYFPHKLHISHPNFIFPAQT